MKRGTLEGDYECVSIPMLLPPSFTIWGLLLPFPSRFPDDKLTVVNREAATARVCTEPLP